MHSQDAQRTATGHAGDPGSGLSRRSLLQGAASAGIAATAIGVVAGPALAAPVKAQADQSADHAADHAEPIVVHVRDARTGDIEVFSGTGQTRLRDRDLAARITRAIR